MLKLVIVFSVLMVVAASPTFPLFASLPSDESLTLSALLQSQQTSSAITLSPEDSRESAATSRESQTSTPAPPSPTSEASPVNQPSADPTELPTSLHSAPLGSLSLQHQFLAPETLSLPLTISTSPGLQTVIAPETIRVHEPTIAKVGELVQKIPTAISHQSQTVVHKHADVVTPIIAPAVRTITSQVVRAYQTPLVYAAHSPVLKLTDH